MSLCHTETSSGCASHVVPCSRSILWPGALRAADALAYYWCQQAESPPGTGNEAYLPGNGCINGVLHFHGFQDHHHLALAHDITHLALDLSAMSMSVRVVKAREITRKRFLTCDVGTSGRRTCEGHGTFKIQRLKHWKFISQDVCLQRMILCSSARCAAGPTSQTLAVKAEVTSWPVQSVSTSF